MCATRSLGSRADTIVLMGKVYDSSGGEGKGPSKPPRAAYPWTTLLGPATLADGAGLRRRYSRRAAAITADRGPTWSMCATRSLGSRADTIVLMGKVYDSSGGEGKGPPSPRARPTPGQPC